MPSRDDAEEELSEAKENRKNDGGATTSPKSDKKSAVNVIVRVRPLSTVEHADPSVKNVVQCLKDGIVVQGVLTRPPSCFFGARHAQPRPQHFKVDKVFHSYSTQIEVYEACRDVVASVFDGINGSILAYGATGAGKTHTMFGGSMSVAGVIYQALQDILEGKERREQEENKVVTMRCSFLEVYNEEVFDLLAPVSPRGKRKPLKVQEYGQDDYFNEVKNDVNPETLVVKGLTHVVPKTPEDFSKLVELGQANRFVASTHANAQSSRSHAILTVEVEVKDTMDASLGTVGRVRFCDLAGSERAAGTSNSGARLQEGGNINRSLLALGAVVQALTQRKKNPKKTSYIPYRGSKLTRLLRDCLNGNCRTLMLFCISPSSMNYEETINTMLFAMQAKEIQVLAKRHEFHVDSKEVAKNQEALIEELRLELAQTREELLRFKRNSVGCAANLTQVSRHDSQPFAALTPQSTQLSPNKEESVPAVQNASLVGDADGRSCVLDASTEDSSRTHRIPSRMPLMADVSEAYAELGKKLRSSSVEKETLYREMREAHEASNELDIRLRQEKWKLARFLSTRRKVMDEGSHEEDVASVGVAGLRLAIKNMEAEFAAQGGEMERLLAKMNATDRTIADICQELLREKQHPFLELLLDNVKLRQSSTEAECLAAHYHQECRCIKNREEEYAQALGQCVSVIRHLLSVLPGCPITRERAQVALMFANLPSLSTEEMVPAFERSMKSLGGSSEVLADPQQSAMFSKSVEAAGTQCLVKNRKNGGGSSGGSGGSGNSNNSKSNKTNKNDGSRSIMQPAQQRQLERRVKAVIGVSTPQKGVSAKKTSRTLVGANAAHSDQEPDADLYNTKAVRTRAMHSPTLAKKPVGILQTVSTNGTKPVSSRATKKSTRGASASPSKLCNGTGGAGLTKATPKARKAAAAPISFGRAHTASEISHNGRSHAADSTPPATRERARKLKSTTPRSNHVTFLERTSRSTAHSKPSSGTLTTAGRSPDSTPSARRSHNAYLEERYHRLLTEIQQWRGSAAAARGREPRSATHRR